MSLNCQVFHSSAPPSVLMGFLERRRGGREGGREGGGSLKGVGVLLGFPGKSGSNHVYLKEHVMKRLQSP